MYIFRFFLLALISTLTACSVVPLPELPNNLSASTPFLAFPYEGKMNVTVKRNEKFIVQNIRYADKIMLTNPYIGDGEKIIFPAKTELFLVIYHKPANFGALAAERTYKAYCGLTTKLSSLSRWAGGIRAGDNLLCFYDKDKDGNLDRVTSATGASKNPVTVFELADKFHDITPIEYKNFTPNSMKPDGMIWLKSTNRTLEKPIITMFIGDSVGEEKLSRNHIIEAAKNLPQNMYFSGSSITILKDENGTSTIQINNPMPTNTTFAYQKTIIMTRR